jgi:hypothetical protein
MSIKILSWNAQSLCNDKNVISLKTFLSQNFYHVVLLQETWLNDSKIISIPGYDIIRKDRPNPNNLKTVHGGVAILVHRSFNAKSIRFCETNFIDSVFLQIVLHDQSVTLGSIYASSNNKTLNSDQFRLEAEKLLSRPGAFMLVGDWNSKHQNWNGSKNNQKGTILNELANKFNCKIVAPEEPTCGFSTLDLAVVKEIAGVSASVRKDLFSDHHPVEFTLFSNHNIPARLKVFNVKNANFKKFRQFLTSMSSEIDLDFATTEEIDKAIEMYDNWLVSAQKISIPLKNQPIYRHVYSQRARNLIKLRKIAEKESRTDPAKKSDVNRLKKLIKDELFQDNRKKLEDHISSLDLEDLSLFKFAKIIKKKAKPIPALEDENEVLLCGSKDKADLLASAFAKSHLISSVPTKHSAAVQNSMEELENCCFEMSQCVKISVTELSGMIANLNVKKASGYDKISNRILKNIPLSLVKFLTNVFNSCFALGYFPDKWKIGKIVAIPKPNKKVRLASSYRPITLLPTTGKLFEKLILTRFQDVEEDKKIFVDQQFGFRSKHSTIHQIVRIAKTISDRFNANKSTALVTMDIEKAFDAVWHEALLHKLLFFNFPIYLIKIIQSFLSDRYSYVAVGSADSYPYKITAGVPQGSPLSPFLFNVYFNDTPIPKHCKLAGFADDTGLLSSIHNYDLPKLVERLNNGLNQLQSHFQSWKVKVNKGKTESMLFTHSRKMKDLAKTNPIKFDEVELKWCDILTYLGVKFDPKLSFKPNIEYNVKKAQKAVSSLYCLIKKFSRLNQKCKLTLYRSYIRPTMTYACPVFANSAKTHIQKLQIQQNKCLRMVLSAHYRTRIKTLHLEANIPLMTDFIAKLTDKFYTSCALSKNPLIQKLDSNPLCSPNRKPKHKLLRP